MTFAEYTAWIETTVPGSPSAEPFATDAAAAAPVLPAVHFSPVIGAALPRIDGPLKTTGTAQYAADFHPARMVYAVPVCAKIAHGQITSLDSSAAQKMPGVLLVLDHTNIGPLNSKIQGGRNSENRTPFADLTVAYWGQYVAAVVAETYEQAVAAADAVKVSYAAEKINVSPALNDELPALGAPGGPRSMSHRGDTTTVFASAPVKIDAVYSTPVETHNPMEMHAAVAVYDNGKYTLYEASQGVMNHRTVMAQILGCQPEDITVISRFIGSGFGGKLFPWPHSMIAAVASKQLNRPVKLSVTRAMMFSNVGHRPRTEQRIRLGAAPDGTLLSLEQNYRNHTSLGDDIRENCGEATPFLYATSNMQVTSALVRRTVGTPTPMRGPGAVPGLFALESAMDELAIALKMDPVALRLKLDTTMDLEANKPFSSRHLKECLSVGSERFGWANRTPEVGSMRKGDLILGYGLACASWGAGRGNGSCSLSLRQDGTVRIKSGTQDPGTGTYTIIAQIASDKLGVPTSRIDVILGDSALPPGPMSGGSTATASIIPAIAAAALDARTRLLAAAVTVPPFHGRNPAALDLANGRVFLKGSSPDGGMPFAEILKLANLQSVDAEGKSGPRGDDAKAFSFHSFGAQFVEVEYDPYLAKIRVSRVVSVVDGGRILNMRTATNQMAGAIVMGVGMALFEETVYDPRNGHAVNDNYADYLVATSADAPAIDVHFLDIPDPLMGEYGARGLGEIGLAGIAPAITNAVYHASGVRVRALPVRVEDMLTSRVSI